MKAAPRPRPKARAADTALSAGGWSGGTQVQPATELAIELVNNDSRLLPNRTLALSWRDTQCSARAASVACRHVRVDERQSQWKQRLRINATAKLARKLLRQGAKGAHGREVANLLAGGGLVRVPHLESVNHINLSLIHI